MGPSVCAAFLFPGLIVRARFLRSVAAFMDDELVTKLYRVRRSILEVLSDRGYLVLDEELKQTKEEFRKKFGDDPKKEKLLISKKRRESNEW